MAVIGIITKSSNIMEIEKALKKYNIKEKNIIIISEETIENIKNVKFDIIVILITIVAGLVGHFIGKPLDYGIYSSVSMLLGILTTLAAGTKALQGFEPHHGQDESKAEKTEVKEAAIKSEPIDTKTENS